MKWKLILGVLCILLLTSRVVAFADESTYIVTLKDTIGFYSLRQNDEQNYLVVSAEELTEYLDAGIVAEYEPNYKVELFGDSWNLDAVNCDFAWELGCFGNEVRIGVIDSGLYPFPELKNNVIEGKNYFDNSTDTTDNIGHGTFVTGIIASKSKGISRNSKIVPLKCFERDKDTYVDELLDAVYDAIDIYDCDVINMSFGLPSESAWLERAITYATNHGAIVISAVGNVGNTTMYYPAGYDNVIGVGSIDRTYKKSWFSQYNSSVFATAPGEELESLSVDGYIDNSGTSFSAPHVTALAAIAKCIDKNIDTNKFKDILSISCDDLGTAGYDVRYGYGLINFETFINEMLKATNVFISPINTDNEKIYSIIYNNSENEKTLFAIYAIYDSNGLKNCFNTPIKVLPKGKYRFENPISKGYLKYMVWENLLNIKPLTNKRELNN